MSNPTRELIEHWMDHHDQSEPCSCWICRSLRMNLLALDMRDEILDAYEEHPGKAIVHRVMRAVREFNDNSEEDPMLTEGQRRRRR